MSAKKKHRFWWASYAVYEMNAHYWGFREMVFVDTHPFELDEDNWAPRIHSLVSFREITLDEYLLHAEHDPDFEPNLPSPGGRR